LCSWAVGSGFRFCGELGRGIQYPLYFAVKLQEIRIASVTQSRLFCHPDSIKLGRRRAMKGFTDGYS